MINIDSNIDKKNPRSTLTTISTIRCMINIDDHNGKTNA